MIISLTPGVAVERVERALTERGIWSRRLSGAEGAALEVSSRSAAIDEGELRAIDGVADVLTADSKTPLLDKARGRCVRVGDLAIGGAAEPVLMAGPCSAESEPQVWRSAAMAARAGASFLRGGAFKPRTSPYSFSGHGEQALGWLRRAADAHGLRLVTEAMSESHVALVSEYADLVQVGARSMQCYPLLASIGATGRPALLKRAPGATVAEWLAAGEHLLAAGAGGVIFCERGIRGGSGETRNLFDLASVALLKHVHQLPVVADPSHAVGRVDLIPPMAAAALAAGADGLLVEAHPAPGQARSDGPQALDSASLNAIGALLSRSRLAVAP